MFAAARAAISARCRFDQCPERRRTIQRTEGVRLGGNPLAQCGVIDELYERAIEAFCQV
jgi:hypothetical protein